MLGGQEVVGEEGSSIELRREEKGEDGELVSLLPFDLKLEK